MILRFSKKDPHTFQPNSRLQTSLKLAYAVLSILLAMLVAWHPHVFAANESPGNTTSLTRLRVQLQKSDQAQFAGLYMAQAQKYFAEEGLEVELIPGGIDVNPIKQLQTDRADVAIAWLDNAWDQSTAGESVTNVAQVFSKSALRLVCRPSLGVHSPKDIEGKQVGIRGVGEQPAIQAVLLQYGVDIGEIEFVQQREDAKDILDGKLPCVTAMSYNEYWSILNSGPGLDDWLVLDPDEIGIKHIEDGVYVLTQRLASAEFRDTLVKFLRAMREGWQFAERLPNFTLETIIASMPDLDRDRQQQILSAVLPLIPTSNDQFGKFDLSNFDQSVANRRSIGLDSKAPKHLWTYELWYQLRSLDGEPPKIKITTQHYIENIIKYAPGFHIVLIVGVLTFALSGLLEAVSLGYDLWGRLVLAAVASLGGGTLRDFLIGGDRLPLSYVQDPVPTTIVLLVVLGGTILTAIFKDFHKARAFEEIKLTVDIIGFSAIALSGALFALDAGLPWQWVPVCAALSCTGGGMLRDIVINREPRTFKGVIYEEVAVLGAFVLLAGLVISSGIEQSPIGVYLSVIACFLSMVLMRIVVHRYKLQYPAWLTISKA